MLHSRSSFRRGITTLALTVSALALVAAACSSSGSKAATPPAPSSTSTAATTSTVPAPRGSGGGRLSAFRTCLSSHGITLPPRNAANSTTPTSAGRGGGGGGGRFAQAPPGVDPAKFQSAIGACRSQLPAGVGAGAGAGTGAFAGAGGHTVIYKISGKAAPASIVYTDPGGAITTQAVLPHSITVQLPSGNYYSVVAQGLNGGASTTCEVLIDGKSVTTNAATTAADVADCQGTVP